MLDDALGGEIRDVAMVTDPVPKVAVPPDCPGVPS
jgi:hypothetical protein